MEALIDEEKLTLFEAIENEKLKALNESGQVDNNYFTILGRTFIGDYNDVKREWVKSNSGKRLIDHCIETLEEKIW